MLTIILTLLRRQLARPERFELPTPRFVVWCSIQLSYGRLPFREGSPARQGAERG